MGLVNRTLIKAILGQTWKPWDGDIDDWRENIQNFLQCRAFQKHCRWCFPKPVFRVWTVGHCGIGEIPHTGWTGRFRFARSWSDRKCTFNLTKTDRVKMTSDFQRFQMSASKKRWSQSFATDVKSDGFGWARRHIWIWSNPLSLLAFLLRDICYKQQKSILVVTHDWRSCSRDCLIDFYCSANTFR